MIVYISYLIHRMHINKHT